MKVVIINKSDSVGGAAVVARRLLYALRRAGVDAKMLVMRALQPHGDEIEEYGNNLKGRFFFLAERAEIFARNGFSRKNLFKVSTARTGFDLSNHPDVVNADVIYINWINQGALSLDCIDKICSTGKPVVWIMHDMWQLTGICHHAMECQAYRNSCGFCPQLQSGSNHDLSHEIFDIKRSLYSKYRNIHFVAVSHWLASRCSESALLQNRYVHVVPNAFPIERFSCKRRNGHPAFPADKIVAVMGAACLDDPIKGFDILIKATEALAKRPEAERIHMVLYGNIKDRSLIDRIAVSHSYLGPINGEEAIARIYQAADIVVSTSLYETLGGTLIEGAAAGCVPVTFGNSGQADVVEHLRSGYIAQYLNPESVADGIVWASQLPLSREMLHQGIAERFSADAIAQRYIALFKSFL